MIKKDKVIIKNVTKSKNILEGNLKKCNTFKTKFLGLMFTKKKDEINILLFKFNKENYWSFHMFFVFYPITIVFLDSKYKIVDINYNFKPFTTYKPRKKTKFVLEFSKLLTKKDLSIGDTLKLIY